MKKILFSLAVPLVFMATLSAQITQEQADKIIIERLNHDTSDFIIYAKEEVQTNFEITTSIGEMLELNYPCWIYFIKYADKTNGKYLIVKENNGNLLEMNTKNDEGPVDLSEWRFIVSYPIDIPFTKYSLTTSCQWVNLNYDEKVTIINSTEELTNYISCMEGSYHAIDFSKYTLLLASGETTNGISKIIVNDLQQLSCKEYELSIKVLLNDTTVIKKWIIALTMKKVSEESHVELKITTYNTFIIKELPKMYLNGDLLSGKQAVIQSQAELLAIFPQEEIDKYSDLQEIDFNTQTLLIGRDNYCAGANFNYEFSSTENDQYIFKVDIFGNYGVMDYNFLYGIVVTKLPANAEVVFNINKELDCG
jgi:hypothetical protein